MLRRIVLLLGETPASIAARNYAFRLAQSDSAELAGIAGVDTDYIEAPMAGGIGTTAYKSRAQAELIKQAEDARARLRDDYQRECAARKVSCDWLDFAGNPAIALRQAAENCDLMVTGHDTAFRGKLRERLSDTLAELCRMTPRPLIVCGDKDPPIGDVMIAYDGSLPAMRAVQLFALLGLWWRQRVHLIVINDDERSIQHAPASAARYLESRGCDVVIKTITTHLHPAEILRDEIQKQGIGMLVMGVYGHRGLRDRLFGSTTTRLLEDPPCALFVYH